MYSIVELPGSFTLTIKDTPHSLTQSELDHVASLIMPHLTPMDRHIFTLFEKLSPEERNQVALLLKP